METNEIRYFLATARELNFTRAAESCGVSQPTLTRAIQKLEVELGGALFLRRPRQVELTRLGRDMLPRFEEIARCLDSVRREASSMTLATKEALRLGVMCTVSPGKIINLLNTFKGKLPDANVTVTEGTAKRIVELVATDQVDIGIAAWPSYPAAIAVQNLYEERYVIAMNSMDPLAGRVSVPLEDLNGSKYLQRLSCEFDDYFAARHGNWPIDLDIRFASEREDWIQALILAGHGCAIVPELTDLRLGIITRPLVEPEVTREVGLITLRGHKLPAPAQAFMRFAARNEWRQS